MLDVLVPMWGGNANAALASILSVRENTSVPFRFIVVFDGGVQKDYREIQKLIYEEDGQVFRHNRKFSGFKPTLEEALSLATAEFIALIPPEVFLDDDKWFNKAWQVFQRDPQANRVYGVPGTKSKTLAPHRISDEPMKQFMIARREALDAYGCHNWRHPGILYHLQETKAHKEWCEQSKDEPVAPVSRSWMIRD